MKFILILWVLSQSLPAAADVCPYYFRFMDTKVKFSKHKIKQVKLFKLANKTWQQADVQIDPINEEGIYLFYKKPGQLQEDVLYKEDRIVFDDDAFGDRYRSSMTKPCGARKIYEIESRSAKPRYAYLAFCREGLPPSVVSRPPVEHLEKERKVKAPNYIFNYSALNHILFDQILVPTRDKTSDLSVAEDADLRIHMNMRNFFNLDFDSSDIVSKIETERTGTKGFLAFAAFFLKILFFKIDLKLHIGISFWQNAVHIPMIMHVPVRPEKWVRLGSGMTYSWVYDPAKVKYDHAHSSLPKYAKDLRAGLQFCAEGADACRYSLTGSVEGQNFAMDFRIPRALVERGFFPQWTVSKDEKDPQKERLGLYFEASGLAKGEHHWEFWIKLADSAEQNLQELCPKQIQHVRAGHL